jgi:hypothetical protein
MMCRFSSVSAVGLAVYGDGSFIYRGSCMKTVLKTVLISSLVLAGAQAIADDSPSDQGAMTQAQKKQMWDDCMAKQKAGNAGLTQAAMETACKNEMKKGKMQKDGNNLPTAPTPDKN